MGRRHRASAFMPSVYVFPGGRLEAADRRPTGFPEPLAIPGPDSGLDLATSRDLARFARAAIRETYEETGLLLGHPAAPALRETATTGHHSLHHSGQERCVWRAFAQAGLMPAFSAMTLVARAITPAGSPRRFHTRFFLADGAAARGSFRGDGELEDLRWVPLAEIPGLPLPAEVTALVLREALAHHALAKRPARDTRSAATAGPAVLGRRPLAPPDRALAGVGAGRNRLRGYRTRPGLTWGRRRLSSGNFEFHRLTRTAPWPSRRHS